MKNLRNIGIASLVIGALLLSLISISGCSSKQKNEIAALTEKVEQIEKDMSVLKNTLTQKEAENQQLRSEIDSLKIVIVKKDEQIRIAKSTSPTVSTAQKSNKLITVGYFGFDKKDISPEFKVELKRVVEFCQRNKSVLFIQGYADPQGDNNYNIMLSLQRAKNTRDYIIKEIGNGQLPCDIVTVGLGTPSKDTTEPNKDKRKVIITVVEDCTGRK